MGHGDEVLVPSNTFIATWLAVTQAGATPVPVEPDPMTHNVSAKAVEAVITPATKAIMPVHLYGSPADMDGILAIGRDRGIPVVEDAAQAQGACYRRPADRQPGRCRRLLVLSRQEPGRARGRGCHHDR